jgi:hypothetical protein
LPRQTSPNSSSTNRRHAGGHCLQAAGVTNMGGMIR